LNEGNDLWAATRRRTLKAIAAATAALGLPGVSWAGKRLAPGRYNVLWLMSDEHSPFVAGYAGDRRAITPNLDALAKTSVQFRSAYTPDPICVPARQAFHTGRMSSNINYDTPNYEALGPYFTRMGFKTAWFGKQHWEHLTDHLHFQDEGVDCGKEAQKRFKNKFRRELPELTRDVDKATVCEDADSDWSTDYNEGAICTEQALAYLDGIGSKQFFMGVSYVKPHFPFAIQRAYYELYSAQRLPRPKVTQAMLDNLSPALKEDRDFYGFDDLEPEKGDFTRAIYYGMVSYIDEQIGKVLARLDALDLRRNTIVIYMADHGEMLGQHGIWYKNAFLEGSGRVPMLISLPRGLNLPKSLKIDAPVNLIDLYPTLCELLGLVPPSTLEGHSLVPLINGSDNGSTRAAFSENKRNGIAARMIRTPEFKYCYYMDEPVPMEQLYDMRGADRDIEGTNLASDPNYAQIKAELKARALDGWNPDGLFDDGS
jgi:choline-sulfatase